MPSVNPGQTSLITTVFIQDTTSTTGGGLTGLTPTSTGLTCFYKRSNGTASVAVSLATIATLGTFVSGGFKEIDSTNMPGLYEFDPPDAGQATGATGVTYYFRGATNMAPLAFQIDLTTLTGTINANIVQVGGVAAPNDGAGHLKVIGTVAGIGL